ncbi:MAG: hypothetical protein HYW70_00755 [Candidatus Nealsonbacteria bacterium]|nr:hypothetical protein [Candidatus Nealsonbacteria bacterium]
MDTGSISKKELYDLKKERKENERTGPRQKNKAKKWFLVGVVILVSVGGVFAVSKYLAGFPSASKENPENRVIARAGIHWHPHLSIKILSQEQGIPAGIGLGIVEQSIHTHESDGIIHLEHTGLTREKDIKLGNFFKVWGKRFNGECIFDKCSGPEGELKMFVNGKPNFEFENYLMRDEDKIEILFE